MGWNFGWILEGGLAYLFAFFNLIRTFLGRQKGWEILMFLSLSFGGVTVLEEYRMVNTWLQSGDLSAIYDVVPMLTNYLAVALLIGILLNLIVLVINLRRY